MYDQIYKRIDDNIRKDSGCGSELDYVEQSNWILFIKYLDNLEKGREATANDRLAQKQAAGAWHVN